jgi:hypothetical protein
MLVGLARGTAGDFIFSPKGIDLAALQKILSDSFIGARMVTEVWDRQEMVGNFMDLLNRKRYLFLGFQASGRGGHANLVFGTRGGHIVDPVTGSAVDRDTLFVMDPGIQDSGSIDPSTGNLVGSWHGGYDERPVTSFTRGFPMLVGYRLADYEMFLSGLEGSLAGRWWVRIGDWKGVFVFQANGSASWSDVGGGPSHAGRWVLHPFRNEYIWQFFDDPPGFGRIFAVAKPVYATSSGKVYPLGYERLKLEVSNDPGVSTADPTPIGFFEMSRSPM